MSLLNAVRFHRGQDLGGRLRRLQVDNAGIILEFRIFSAKMPTARQVPNRGTICTN